MLALVACAGCQQIFGLAEPAVAGDARLPDTRDGAGSDAAIDALDNNCFGHGIVRACFTQPLTLPFSLSATTTVNTDGGPPCMPLTNTTSYCAIGGTDISINHTLVAQGSRPLVLVAVDTIQVMQLIDVSSKRGVLPGAGANMPGCAAGTAPSGADGGAGGSFGASGGAGNNNDSQPGLPLLVASLRGGCPGVAGGGTVSSPGAGGGAVYLIAGSRITIPGQINASGAGGDGGSLSTSGTGGSGGGAGGYIGLEAPTVDGGGTVYANGGGAGEGGDTVAGSDGSDPMNYNSPASGGNNGSVNGGKGGQGAYGANSAGVGANSTGANSGGGGGGGGVGIIHLVGATSLTGNTRTSPPPS